MLPFLEQGDASLLQWQQQQQQNRGENKLEMKTILKRFIGIEKKKLSLNYDGNSSVTDKMSDDASWKRCRRLSHHLQNFRCIVTIVVAALVHISAMRAEMA